MYGHIKCVHENSNPGAVSISVMILESGFSPVLRIDTGTGEILTHLLYFLCNARDDGFIVFVFNRFIHPVADALHLRFFHAA